MIRTCIATLLLLYPAIAMADQKSQARAALDRMGQADLNHDGIITRDEVHAMRGGLFARLDRDRDGVITALDIPDWLTRMNSDINFTSFAKQFDANKDRKISRDEWVNGPMLVFDLADTNRDNQITADERKSAMAR
ncbi:MAG: hypothetical protein RL367_2029, partial [Pseudomonadota bacterium]